MYIQNSTSRAATVLSCWVVRLRDPIWHLSLICLTLPSKISILSFPSSPISLLLSLPPLIFLSQSWLPLSSLPISWEFFSACLTLTSASLNSSFNILSWILHFDSSFRRITSSSASGSNCFEKAATSARRQDTCSEALT